MDDEGSTEIFMLVSGLSRWSEEGAAKVATALRTGALTSLQAWGLANLLDGSNPFGHFLKMHGQTNADTIEEGAQRYDRAQQVGRSVSRAIAQGAKPEDALLDAEEEFGISVTTARRCYQAYKALGAND